MFENTSPMSQYKRLNIYVGWLTFAIAAVVYLLTIEPTASFWDCGEFITTSYKMEVGHPPGAPVFMIFGRFFTLFTDPGNAAMMVNIMSALASAFTILFLFWTITHLAKKMIANGEHLTRGNAVSVLAAGVVGSLAYTFSDTFWFSAVEGEVYAFSSMLTAIVFWAILKWENVADTPHANRWLILIAYVMGLSIGVHLLNLLAIPAIVFVYYFRKYKLSPRGIIYSLLISVAILGAFMYVVIPGIVSVGSWFERMFVNGFSLAYHSGLVTYTILLFAAIAWGLYYTSKKKKIILNTIILFITVIVIGYSSFAMIVIRSIANPPMDENNPETVFNLLHYINREQYGSRPLFKGQYYNAPIVDSETPYTYRQKNGKYIKSYSLNDVYEYDERFTTLFPRMYSPDPSHVEEYKKWADIKGKKEPITNYQGEQEIRHVPTFGENLKFFFRYQLGHMYWRYFMWNFSGRQNDTQGHGELLNGNWISGINFIDNKHIGPQDNLPDSIKNHKARNTYFMLPLLLGLFGFFFHLKRHSNDFMVVLLLFILTGIAIVVYLNQYPMQPRERDYAYAGSFYAFSIWIGIGVAGLIEYAGKKLDHAAVPVVIAVASLVAVPGLMAMENWDDHDRSDRYTARAFARNYLNSVDENAIIFTNGDNDTFPLWYVQEVEGFRTDVRVVNLSYLTADWYIEQMMFQFYESDPLPLSMSLDDYRQGTRDYVYLV